MLRLKSSINTLLLLMLFCINALPIHAQQPVSMNPPSNKEDRNFFEDRNQWQEIPEKREPNSRSFRTPDGRIIIQYSKELLNYRNGDNELVPVNYTPTISDKGLVASAQPYPVTVNSNGSVNIDLKNGQNICYSGNTKFMGSKLKYAPMLQKENFAVMKDVYPGIDKTFEFRFNSVKYNYVINRRAFLTRSAVITIDEELELPQGAKIQPDHRIGQEGPDGWQGVLSIVSADGKEIGSMRGALCYDADNKTILASYQIIAENGKQKVRMVIPTSWMMNAKLPVTIDPLVTGPTSSFVGYIPSCIAPASDPDSILVTIPAQVTVTALMVSGSFYANPFTTATMSMGAMYFSTTCATSTTFTVTGSAGGTAGTAYLTAYDLKSPLLCCFPQSCTAQTFYLRMHITRTGPGTGCNTTYIYHDYLGGYPFSAYVEGHTPEPFGPGWNVSPLTICSDVCTLTGTVYTRYGVPPFTITHPWMSGSVTAGIAAGCSSGSIVKALTLTIPACPWTCDTISVLSVPPATVIDACGTAVSGLLPKNVNIKEVPEVTASPNPITICSGETFSSTLTPCLGTSIVSWAGNGNSGTGTTISEMLTNTSGTVSATTYSISAVNNGCQSDTITLVVNTDPLPIASFTATPQPVVINNPLTFTDNTAVFGGIENAWYWDFGDGIIDINQDPVHGYNVPGTYTVCFAMQTSDGCVDTVCQNVEVIPAEIKFPNVVTANGDNQNDLLYFEYLQYFGMNTLQVFDRWGKKIYEKENYSNDWSPGALNDGTYYYVLTLTEKDKSYPGFFQVIRN